jgi:hypothetical protein
VVWTCPQCGAPFAAGATVCPRCAYSLADLTPAPVTAEGDARVVRDRLLAEARTSKTLCGPPMLFPGERVVLETAEDPRALARHVLSSGRGPLIALTVFLGLLGVIGLGTFGSARWLVLGLVLATLLAIWGVYLLWIRSLQRVIPPRFFLTQHRLLVWIPQSSPAARGRTMLLEQLLGVQLLPQPDGTTMLRIFRRPEDSGPSVGSVAEDLIESPRGGGRIDLRPLLMLSMLGPGPPPRDPRLMTAASVLWMKSIESTEAELLRAEIGRRVPTAIMSW